MGERFFCPRCRYARELKPGENGYNLYIIHEERCNPAVGRQLWLPCISEDDLNWFPSGEQMALRPAFLLVSRGDLDRGIPGAEMSPPEFGKAA